MSRAHECARVCVRVCVHAPACCVWAGVRERSVRACVRAPGVYMRSCVRVRVRASMRPTFPRRRRRSRSAGTSDRTSASGSRCAPTPS